MKSLYNTQAKEEMLQRLENLKPDSKGLWGKMTVSQMLTHCSRALETATDEARPPRIFLGRILSPFVKSMYYSDKPWGRNSPTAPSFVVIDNRNFEKEKSNLKNLINRFADAGPDKCTTYPHSFFGKLTPEQWAMGMYKHLDHHFRQFGV